MCLYLESSKIIRGVLEKQGAIKTLVYSSNYQNKKQLYALVCETLKYSNILQTLVDKTCLLKLERQLKNDSVLAQVLLYELILGKGLKKLGKYRTTIGRHKSRIHAECEMMKIKAKVTSLQGLLPNHVVQNKEATLPRYVRVNQLLTTVDRLKKKLVSEGWTFMEKNLPSFTSFIEMVRSLKEKQFMLDLHLPDVLIFPPGTDFHDHAMCTAGEIILQDKASCIPAYILSPPEGSHVIDSCAAPGNKTSHLASLMMNSGKIFAFDKDKSRAVTMRKLISKAGVTNTTVYCLDFLSVDPEDKKYAQVEYILVDPSCSGSGIIHRLNQVTDDEDSSSKQRLQNLCRFQTSILKHAFRFPSVRRIVYSTCSIHSEENEHVISNVISHLSEKFCLKKVLPEWPDRGQEGYEFAPMCLRMTPERSLTNGFFVACFERLQTGSYDGRSSKSEHEANVQRNEEHKRPENIEQSMATHKCKESASRNKETKRDCQNLKKKRKRSSKEENTMEKDQQLNKEVSENSNHTTDHSGFKKSKHSEKDNTLRVGQTFPKKRKKKAKMNDVSIKDNDKCRTMVTQEWHERLKCRKVKSGKIFGKHGKDKKKARRKKKRSQVHDVNI